MLSTKLVIHSAAAIALCYTVAAQNGAVTGTATIGSMDDTFTIPFDEWDGTSPPECTSVMAGCTGDFVELAHETGGTVTVLDDCTFRISKYTFDGEGPAVEWWASKQEGSPKVFPYPQNAIKVAELGQVGNYQTGMNVPGGSGEVVVRLGLGDDGSQLLLSPDLDHISLWCEDYAVDFGNAALECPDVAPGPGPADAGPLPAPMAAATPVTAAGPGPAELAPEVAPVDAMPEAAPMGATPEAAAPVDAPVDAMPEAVAPVDVPVVVEPAMALPATPPATSEPDAGEGGAEAAESEAGEGDTAGADVDTSAAGSAVRLVSAGTLAAAAAALLL